MASVSTNKAGKVTGTWAAGKLGTVGLVADDAVGSYLVIFGTSLQFPALAIYAGRDGKAKLQLPGPKGTAEGCRVVDIEDMLEMIGLGYKAGASPLPIPNYDELAAMFPSDEAETPITLSPAELSGTFEPLEAPRPAGDDDDERA